MVAIEKRLQRNTTLGNTNLQALEKVWGKGYISANDNEIIEEVFYPCFPTKKDNILEIDSGLGTHLKKISQQFNLYVDGIEKDPLFYKKSLTNISKVKNRVILHNIGKKPTIKNYDLIFAKNKFHLYPDKKTLFENLLFSLKPQGKLIFSDFFFPRGKDPEELKLANRWIRYQKAKKHITTIQQYESLLIQTNFKTHINRDISETFIKLASASFKHSFLEMKKQSFEVREKKILLETYQSFYSMLEAITKKELFVYKIHAERII